jgi:hypothetical protein
MSLAQYPLQAIAPNSIPRTVPIAAITIAVVAFGSFFDFATAPSTRPIGPKTIGKIQIAIPPMIIATVEKELLVVPG